jgi:hypothetical protein
MRDHWAEMDYAIFVESDSVKVGDTGHVNESLYIFSDSALNFED